MARPINASLYVYAFTPTGGPGEYTFENATFDNQADRTGNGAFDVAVGFVIYVPSTDLNSSSAIPGSVHRYVITSVSASDPATLSGTISWDEPGLETDEVPTNGVGCLLAETSPNNQLAFLPLDTVYPALFPGSSLASTLLDTFEIVDNLSSGGSTSATYKETIGNSIDTIYTVSHGFNTNDVTVSIFDITTGGDVFCDVDRVTPAAVTLTFTEPPAVNNYRVLVRN